MDRTIPKVARLLDVGGGLLASLIHVQVGYILLDKSVDCIARAQVAKKLAVDATAMPFEPETFDVATSISTAQ